MYIKDNYKYTHKNQAIINTICKTAVKVNIDKQLNNPLFLFVG